MTLPVSSKRTSPLTVPVARIGIVIVAVTSIWISMPVQLTVWLSADTAAGPMSSSCST